MRDGNHEVRAAPAFTRRAAAAWRDEFDAVVADYEVLREQCAENLQDGHANKIPNWDGRFSLMSASASLRRRSIMRQGFVRICKKPFQASDLERFVERLRPGPNPLRDSGLRTRSAATEARSPSYCMADSIRNQSSPTWLGQ